MRGGNRTFGLLALSLFGMCFSGYLTAGVMLNNSCPLNGGCTKVLGLPSCLYGFAMYTIMLTALLLVGTEHVPLTGGRKLVQGVSVVGMLFAGSLLGWEYAHGSQLAICAIGFVMYLLIFIVVLRWKDAP